MIWWVRAAFGLAVGALLVLAWQAYLRQPTGAASDGAGPGTAPTVSTALNPSPTVVAAPRPTATTPALVSRMARTTPTALPGAAGATNGGLAVSISDAGFAPAELRVQVGHRVTRKNEGQQGHDVTVFGGAVASWGSGLLAPGGKFQRAFVAPGQHDYVCTLHAGMCGRIVEDP